MLKHLHIKNYALISELDIDMANGFSVITGETGSGKSILLGALGLVLGKRADTSILFDKGNKCIIEAEFQVLGLEKMFKAMDLDYEEFSTFRREISPSGRSRAFVNDTPVQLQDLRSLSSTLVDVHSQHETLMLQGADIQLDLVDSFAPIQKELRAYRNVFYQWKETKERLETHRKFIHDNQIDEDYLRFQLQELADAGLKEGEQDVMESELRLMENAGEIKETLSSANSALSDDDRSILALLLDMEAQLSRIAEHGAELGELASRIKSCRIELDDINTSLLDVDRELNLDPERMGVLQEKVNELNRLQSKHGQVDTAGLILLESELAGKLSLAENSATTLKRLEEELIGFETGLREKAKVLSNARAKSILKLEKKINSMLPELALSNGRIQIQLDHHESFGPNGGDKVTFLFSANKGGELKALSKVASGGELSRVMLIMKSVLASSAGLPTLIFDEIDTGVSGEIASRMADMLIGIAHGRQVIAISHLAQVASKAETHYKISKKDLADRSVTVVTQLSEKERVMEIAQMLSGTEPGKASIANAKELLKQ